MKKINDVLPGNKTAAILGHIRPDGDCVGSCLGLYHYLKAVCPELQVQVYLEEFPPEFQFLKDADKISHDFHDGRTYDLCFAMDSSDRGRLGDAVTYLDTAEHTVCIDHHITNQGLAQINIIEPKASSASEVLTTLLDMDQINLDAAQCLYLGMVHDTGVFKHSNTSERTMCLAGAMLSKGVNSSRIIDDTFYRKTFRQNKVLGHALLKSELYLEGKVIGCIMTREDLAKYQATTMDLEGVIDQMRVTEGVEIAALFYEKEPDNYKISLRSNELADVSAIAGNFGGGGHVKAAGGSYDGDPAEALNQVLALAAEQLENK